MVKPRNATIESYFKKSSPSLQRKRPCPENSPQKSRRASHTKSTADYTDDEESARHEKDACEVTSQSTTLSFLDGRQETSGQPLLFSQPTPTRKASTRSVNDRGAPEFSKLQSQNSICPPAAAGTTSVQEPESTAPGRAAVNPLANKDQHHEITVCAQDENESTSRNPAMASSQPLLVSSQRIVRNGEMMIRNSDDESDASLEDIDELLDNSRSLEGFHSKADSQLPLPDEEETQEIKRTTRGAARARKPPSQFPSLNRISPKKYKFSLEALVIQRKQDEASNGDIARAKTIIESYDQHKASAGERQGILDAKLVESLMREHGDEDQISRLKSAIQRTEALQYGKSWSFFDNNTQVCITHDADFPTMQDERARRLFCKKISRQQAFLSGYAGEYAVKEGLPEEVLLWTMDALCGESRDDLRYSYTSTLAYAAEHLIPLLTPDYIDAQFLKLGATAAALDLNMAVTPHATLSKSTETATHSGLLSFLTLLGCVARDLIADCRVHLLTILCRLALDHSVVKNYHAISVIEETFASLIESSPEDDSEHMIQTVMSSAYHIISDSTLRLQLLQMIPAWLPRLIVLRQRLALAFFFQDSRYLGDQPVPMVDLKLVARHLQEPKFTISHMTDFDDLAASISILSIGIDCIIPSLQPSSKGEEFAFNKGVDVLAAKVNSMFNDIVDTGASHMKRTEAKEVLEGFQRRLEYVVRTKPKPKKLIFGNATIVPPQEKIDTFIESGKPTDLLPPAACLRSH